MGVNKKGPDNLLFRSAPLRADAMKIISAAIRAADPYQAACMMIHRKGKTLSIGSQAYDLRDYENIYVLGAGKATQRIALALEEILGDCLTGGLIVLKDGETNTLKKLPAMHASHPIPGQDSLLAGQSFLEIAAHAGKNDLVISAFTGGSSALAVMPSHGISLQDLQSLNRLLLESGATIFEINAVRKHVSRIKGGRLAMEIFPAELICLTVSDVVGDQWDYITDLTVPDTSTYMDAWNTLDKYRLWDRLPASIRDHLKRGSAIETPKSFEHRYNPILLVPGDAAFRSAIISCQEMGYETWPLEKELEGDSNQEAVSMVKTADDLIQRFPSIRLALVASGETIVTISNTPGKGGPNQEFALGAAIEIGGRTGMIVASIDMDGTDGPTDAAGAIVDGQTVQRGQNFGLNPDVCLERHNSYEFLKTSGDLIFTGPTGTNVNDLMLVLKDPE